MYNKCLCKYHGIDNLDTYIFFYDSSRSIVNIFRSIARKRGIVKGLRHMWEGSMKEMLYLDTQLLKHRMEIFNFGMVYKNRDTILVHYQPFKEYHI